MIEINLIPDVKLELLRARRQQKMVISVSIMVAIASVAVVALMASYAFGVQAFADGRANDGITDESKKLQNIKDLSKTLTIQNQLKKLSGLQADKTVSSRLFDIIGTTVPSGTNRINISRLELDTEQSTITIEADAANGYEAVEVFKKTLAATTFEYKRDGKAQSAVKVASTISEGERRYGEDSAGKRVLRFNLSFKYAEQLFDTDSEEGRVVAPNQQRATDSTKGVPTSLFSSDGGSE